MDFDYEGAEDFGGRILWGRIAIFGFALLLMLILGRCTAGGGADEDQLAALQASNTDAQAALAQKDASIAQLQQQLVDARAQEAPTTPGTGTGDGTDGTLGGTTGTTPPADATTTDASGNRTYVVQAGDTLSTIAQSVYNDPTAFGVIAQANNLGGNNVLQVGDTLIIPDNPDQ
ncbi:hypothetical protein BH23ACT9_BH23ACT9_36090 [soil metagenome]